MRWHTVSSSAQRLQPFTDLMCFYRGRQMSSVFYFYFTSITSDITVVVVMMIIIVICVCCVRCILDDVFAPQYSRSQRTNFRSRFFLFTVECGNWIQDFRFAKQVPLSTLSTRPPHLPERGLWWWLCDYVNALNVSHWGTHFKRLIVISIFHMLFLIRKPLQSGMARLSPA